MKIHFDWKKALPSVIILGIFAIASAIYFQPALEGKIINAGDGINGRAAVQDAVQYHEQTGDRTWWIGSMFSGMPGYQIGGGQYTLDKIMQPARKFFGLGTHNAYFIMLFYLVAFYLLLRAFKIKNWIAMAGAFAIALSSYFFVIIAAAHHGKCYSITWMMLVVVGFILTYRKQYGWGAVLTMFFTYMGFFLHPQMSYYICMLIGILWFAELAIAVRDKEWKHFGIATAVWFASFGIGMGMGSANVFANQEYAKETMRGGHSDLKKSENGSSSSNGSESKGLDLDYATAWSYGVNETATLLVPNYMGGCSGYNLGDKSELEQGMKKLGVPGYQAKGFCQQAPIYWGDKAFTSGPVCVGAIICFLFLLGLLIVDGPYKWALLVATLFSVALAWGRHFMGLTELFYNYFPMYNEFRAVESILIVAEITMPLLAMLSLKAIDDKKLSWKRLSTSILVAGGITAAACLIIAWMSSGMNVTSSYDEQWKNQVGNEIYSLILDQRRALISADAYRSLLFVVLGFVVVYAYAYARYHKEVKHLTLYTGLALTALIVADIWPVDKRFCNDKNFISLRDRDRAFAMQPYEEQILQDKDYYRVLNFENPFNDGRTSYYLKSIGGYSAAKLRRYQDLIDAHIAPEMSAFYSCLGMAPDGSIVVDQKADSVIPVLNMLNMRYAIIPMREGSPAVVRNPYAMGNAWFVNELKAVGNANDESDALKTIDLHHVAVYDSTFADNAHIADLPEVSTLVAYDKEGIELEGEYSPKQLRYHAVTERPRTAVFSEIYYPYGWHATIDGEPVELFRVDYMLRAINIPSGEHEIVMTFEPESVEKGNKLALACFAVFLLTLLGACIYPLVKRKK